MSTHGLVPGAANLETNEQRWSKVVSDFYGPVGNVSLPLLIRGQEGVKSGTVQLSQIEEMYAGGPSVYSDTKIREIGRNLQVVEHDGSTFAITSIRNNPKSNDYNLHVSTYSSDIPGNAGNAYELAELSRAFPDKNIVYCTSFGNGASSPLLKEDASYVAKTGRFTREDERGKTIPLRSVSNLHHVLHSIGINVISVGSDSAGGNVTTALGLAMPEGALQHGFFSSRPNLVDLSAAEIVIGMLYKEGVANAKDNKNMTPDPFRPKDAVVANAKAILDRSIGIETRRNLDEHEVKFGAKIGALVTSMQALRRGPTAGNAGPLLADTNALLQRQPDARITYFLGERDPLYASPGTAWRATHEFLGNLTIGNAQIEAIIHPGTHAVNTYYPMLYLAAKQYAYSR